MPPRRSPACGAPRRMSEAIAKLRTDAKEHGTSDEALLSELETAAHNLRQDVVSPEEVTRRIGEAALRVEELRDRIADWTFPSATSHFSSMACVPALPTPADCCAMASIARKRRFCMKPENRSFTICIMSSF